MPKTSKASCLDEFEGPARRIKITHYANVHAPSEPEKDPHLREALNRSFFKELQALLRIPPSVPIVLEGLAVDLDMDWLHLNLRPEPLQRAQAFSESLQAKGGLFPKGLPAKYEDLSSLQKAKIEEGYQWNVLKLILLHHLEPERTRAYKVMPNSAQVRRHFSETVGRVDAEYFEEFDRHAIECSIRAGTLEGADNVALVFGVGHHFEWQIDRYPAVMGFRRESVLAPEADALLRRDSVMNLDTHPFYRELHERNNWLRDNAQSFLIVGLTALLIWFISKLAQNLGLSQTRKRERQVPGPGPAPG